MDEELEKERYNASGVSALIKIAEELKQVSEDNPFESNIIFCAFNQLQ